MSLSYGALAEAYDELYGSEQGLKHALALELVPSEEPVLDAGCGTGLLATRVLCYFVGLDLSLPMLRVARARGRVARGDLVCGDVELMPFRDRCFRALYSVTVVHEAPCLVEEALRVLRPSGRLVVTLLRNRLELLPSILGKLPSARVVDREQLKDVIIVVEIPEEAASGAVKP